MAFSDLVASSRVRGSQCPSGGGGCVGERRGGRGRVWGAGPSWLSVSQWVANGVLLYWVPKVVGRPYLGKKSLRKVGCPY